MGTDLLMCVLGPLRLVRDEQEIDVGGARQREVLARLAVAGGTSVSAEALLADVWGPVAGDSAAAALHVSVSKLRRAIDPDRQARASSPVVRTAGGYLLAVDTDAAGVEERARRASDLLTSGDLEAASDELTQARRAWHGEPYEGIGEQSWLVLERRRCEELRLYVAALFAETCLRVGRDAAGIVVDLTALAERHPTHERLAVLLAVALYRQQRQDDALGVLRSTRDHLRDESGLDAGRDLQRTEQLILAQEPDPYAPPSRVTVETAQRPTDSLDRGDPLVGRARPRAVLDAAAQAAESGRATTALLVGEAGIGKTRLARSLTDDLVARGWRAVWSHGTEDDGAPALWPWVSVVRDLGRVVDLSPELESFVSGGSPGLGAEPAADRWRQTERIGALLEAAAAAAPLVVVLDDLHWADPASQSLLAELSARSSQSRLLVVVTSRPAGSSVLTQTLARLTRHGVVRLELEGLTDSDVRALAAGAGVEVDARAFRERTGGNPFLLRETLAFAAETGASPLDVVPASVADVLGARLARLPARGEDLLMVASVLGSVIDPATVADLADGDPEEVDDALDAALAVGLLRADGGAIRFRHDLVRETAYKRLGAVRRSRLHGRALSLLTRTGPRTPTLLATHARHAGPGHADEAVQWSMAAATEAAARHAPDSALHWWSAAYDSDRGAPLPDAVRRVKVLLGLVRAQLDAGDAVGAIATRTEAVHAGADAGDPALVLAALVSLDGSLVWLPRPMGRVNAAMVERLERALTATPGPSDAQRCRLLATLAVEIYGPTQQARCDDLTAEALRIAEELGDARLLAFALSARVAATAFPQRERERAGVADRLVEVGRSADLPSFELTGHQFAGRLRLQLFEVRTADRHAEEARRLASRLRLPLPALQQRLWDCSRRALDGDIAASLRMLDDVERLEWPWWGRDAMLATVRLALLLRAGDFEQAAPLLEQAARVSPRLAEDAAALVAVATGRGAVTATGDEDPVPRDWTWLSGGCIHAQAAAALGDRDDIASAYESLLPGSGMIASTGSFDAGPVDGYLADLAAALGRSDDERRHRALLAGLCAREGLPS